MASKKIKVAILGGGCSGIATAFCLSETKALREKFEITVYQQGWRLGGKGATGRNPDFGHRIEEHGLHIWMGFYFNAFRAMHQCYKEWQIPEGAPFKSIQEAFLPCYSAGFIDQAKDDSCDEIWTLNLPRFPGQPWDTLSKRSVLEWISAFIGWLSGEISHAIFCGDKRQRKQLMRQNKVLFKLARVILKGWLLDIAPYGENGFERINQLDLIEWLKRHGAKTADVYEAPPIRALYHMAFAYPDGVSERSKGRMAAGAGIKALLNILFAYKNAPFWRMRGGMGDTVFTPFYQVLKHRGVNFKFFHQVTDLKVASDGRSLDAIEFRIQAIANSDYDPLISVNGFSVWPDKPNIEQLDLSMLNIKTWHQLESLQDPIEVCRTTLNKGQDFDFAVLAIPAPCFPIIAQDLIQNSERFRRMVNNTQSVATMAKQIWLKSSLAELGAASQQASIFSCGNWPFGTWADMSDVLPYESWNHPKPKALIYACDVIPDAAYKFAGYAKTIDQIKVYAQQQWGQSLTKILPACLRNDGAFDHGALFAANDATAMNSQYFRVNMDPSERYVLTLPGTTRYRLSPDNSDYEGLFLAGDWVFTSVNGGSVEAAFESGMNAATSIIRKSG